MKMRLRFFELICAEIALGFLFASSPSLAQSSDTSKMYTIHQQNMSVRVQGMGGAFTAVADDYNALLFNPAGLARLKEGEINLGIGAGADSKDMKLRSDISSISGTDAQKTVQMNQLLESNYGNHYSARLPMLNATWVRPNWGFTFNPVDLSVDLEIHQLAMAAVQVLAYQDSTMAYGRGWKVGWFGAHSDTSIGITGKVIYRAYYSKEYLAADVATNSNLLRADDAQEGITADADIGMLWSPKLGKDSWWRVARPTLGWTVRNVGDYGYLSNPHLIGKNTTKPPSLGRRLDLGSMFELPDWWVFRSRFMVDMRDIGDENWQWKKGLHLGAEFPWKVRSWWQGAWRVGANQGYFTAGFTGLFAMFQLDISTYGEEEGTSSSPKSNRIYMAKASLDW